MGFVNRLIGERRCDPTFSVSLRPFELRLCACDLFIRSVCRHIMAKTAGGIVTLLGDPDSTRSDKFYCYRARAEFACGQGSRVAGDRGGTVKLAHVRRLFATAVDVWIKQVERDF